MLLSNLLVLALAGCNGGDKDTVDPDETFYSVVLDPVKSSDGLAEFEVEVGADDTSFLFTAEGDNDLSIEELRGPDGDVVVSWQDWAGDYSLTNAFYVNGNWLSFNWPIREADGELTPGTWTVVVATTNAQGNYVSNVEVRPEVLFKRDQDLTSSHVKIHLVYCDGVQDEPGVPEAMDAALARWADIWDDYGLTMEYRSTNSTINANLAYPGEDDALAEASADADGTELLMLIGEEIGGESYWLGFAGGIPGSPLPGQSSGVLVSWLGAAGTDGEFDDEEVRIFGETMAHEVGHFQGLFHPVEDGFDYFDALDDTPECTNANTCENALAPNLMFPYTVCDNTSCDSQDDLTDEQVGVIMRYTGSP